MIASTDLIGIGQNPQRGLKTALVSIISSTTGNRVRSAIDQVTQKRSSIDSIAGNTLCEPQLASWRNCRKRAILSAGTPAYRRSFYYCILDFSMDGNFRSERFPNRIQCRDFYGVTILLDNSDNLCLKPKLYSNDTMPYLTAWKEISPKQETNLDCTLHML